jgi:rod shape determining protein RodA
MYRDDQRRLTGLLVPLLLASAPALLVLKEPDLGTALVFLPVLAAMLFGAGARLRDLAVLATLGVLLLPAFWSQMSREQRSRVTALLSPARADQRPTADTYHLHQARQMIALGGWLGSAGGDGAVDDRLTPRVPEPHTDSIFALLCERLGLIGAGGVLACYGLMVARGLAIAQATREPFGRLLALGLSTLLGVEALINTGMMAGLVPITGLSLPLVSYGGSGLVAHGIALGLLVNVALRPGYEVGGEPFRFGPSLSPA